MVDVRLVNGVAAPKVDGAPHLRRLGGHVNDRHIYYASPDAAVNLANVICNDFEGGSSLDDVALHLYQANAEQGGHYTDDDLGIIIGAAVPAFCPGYLDEIPG